LEADVRAQAEEFLMATREECQGVMANLAEELQSEIQAMADPKRVCAMMEQLDKGGDAPTSAKPDSQIAELRREVNSAVADLRKDLEKDTVSLRAQVSSISTCQVELRKEVETRVGQETASAKKQYVQQSDLTKLRQEIAGDVQGLSSELQRLKESGYKEPCIPLSPCNSSSDFSRSADFSRSSPLPLQHRPPLMTSGSSGDVSRGRLRPRTPSLSSAKSRKSDMSTYGDQDGVSSECFQGMVRAVTAIARVVGFFKDGSAKLGEGEWEWAKIGDRFEQSWTLQTKELWQFGMPLRPTIVDFLRSNCKGGLLRDAAAKLPDKREGARLAERLASGLTSQKFDPSASAVRQLSQYTSMQKEDASSADTTGADQSKRAFAGLEALRQMRRQKNE
jgi:hypothetical protein